MKRERIFIPSPQSGMFERGARVYAANGCVYCHSQQVRADYAADDIERKWGDRRSAPRDYIFDRPVFLGKMRMGQDLANIGARAPAPEESPSPAGVCSPAATRSGGLHSHAGPHKQLRRRRQFLPQQHLPHPPQVRLPRFPPDLPRLHLPQVRLRRTSPVTTVVTAARATNGCCFTITRTNGKHDSRRKQPRSTERADSGRAVADPDRGFAADVFCGLASCASVFATQHQYRFEHAVIPFPLRKATHRWRAFGGCVATLRFGRATGGVGDCSELRCEMSCRLFAGAESIPSIERNQIDRKRIGAWPITRRSGAGCVTGSHRRLLLKK